MRAGYHRARLDGSRLSSGVYMYRLVAGNSAEAHGARAWPAGNSRQKAGCGRKEGESGAPGDGDSPRAGQARS